ncbi:hypothetical protein KIW84_055640 [Lathyrus oleraceus]|uniref:Malectin-like domain-containing protein n=1 Tax=Pisum sativum TaxID=3888 RepID=A0A9D5ALL4_PEA|nr:hypothetical protein KIW84_055640 [Pisum sativum]
MTISSGHEAIHYFVLTHHHLLFPKPLVLITDQVSLKSLHPEACDGSSCVKGGSVWVLPAFLVWHAKAWHWGFLIVTLFSSIGFVACALGKPFYHIEMPNKKPIMMDWRQVGLIISALNLLTLVCFCATFVPADNYLIDCGSTSTTSVGNLNFTSDTLSKKSLTTQQEILATTSANSVSSKDDESPFYRTARVFTGSSKYTFPINQQKNPFMKEYSINVTTDTLEITFHPLDSSVAFVNEIEVVSAPDDLITDDAFNLNPLTSYSGLGAQALETFFLTSNLANDVSNILGVKYADGGATQNTASPSVYGTAAKMNTDTSTDDTNLNFNVTWQFDVEPGFQYLVRAHFCDIVSKALNLLYFNVYIDSMEAAKDLDLSSKGNNVLGVPYSMDLITPLADNNKLNVSIGASTSNKDNPYAILTGLEIMKMNNSISSLSANAASGAGGDTSGSSSSHVGLIAGVSVEVVSAVVLAGVCCILCRKRRRLAQQR